jgi:hypothetical protein
MQLAGAVLVAGEQGEPAETGEPGGDLRAEAQLLSDTEAFLVDTGGLGIVTADLGE